MAKLVKGVNDFATVHPELVEEWDFDKNEFGPDEVTQGSNKKVWWKCKKCGHNWLAAINDRSNGNGCGVCSGRSIVTGFNDLATTNPELAKEWNYAMNIGLYPTQVTSGSHKKVWWKCGKGHEWPAVIHSRAKGHGCPYCSGRFAIKGETDLESLFPDLAIEWNQERNGALRPNMVSCGSKKIVWWKCKDCGYEWQRDIYHRAIQKWKCPRCNSRRQTSFPEQAVFYYLKQCDNSAKNRYKPKWLERCELDVFLPSYSIGIEYDGARFHQDIIHDQKKNQLCANNKVKLIRIRAQHCPTINNSSCDIIELIDQSDEALEFGIKSLLSLIEQMTGISFDVDINLLRDKAKIMEQTHLHTSQSAKLISANGSSICSYKYVKPGVNDLATANPKLASEWHPTKNGNITPEMVTRMSNKKVWWLCHNCGYEWQARVHNRSRRSGCPACSHKKRYETRRLNAEKKKEDNK